jgi:hypothetical protein
MMMRDDAGIQGRLTVRKYTAGGELVEEVTAHNDITLAGRYLVSKLFSKDSANVARVTKMFLGRSDGAFSQDGTALADKAGETPVKTPIETSEVLDPVTGRKRVLLRLYGELAEGEVNDVLKEAGLFTDDNVMYNRVTFGAITKTPQFKLTLTWEITF